MPAGHIVLAGMYLKRSFMLTGITWDLILMQLFYGLALGSVFVLLASGLSIIYGLMDVVNFAHGTFAMLGAYAVFVAVSLTGSFVVGIISAVIIVGLIGAVVEILLLKPLYGKDPLLPLLLTFGLSVAIPDIIKIFFGLIGKPVPYPPALGGARIIGPVILSNYRIFVIVFTLAVLVFLWLFLKKSDLGMIIRAATRDRLMVQVLGINISRIWTVGFGLGIGLAALAGAIVVPLVAATPDMGVDMTMVAFVVTVVGGLGSLGGAIVGGLLIGVIVSFTSLIAGEYSSVAMYFCMAAILLIRPRGLFGESGRE